MELQRKVNGKMEGEKGFKSYGMFKHCYQSDCGALWKGEWKWKPLKYVLKVEIYGEK